MLVLFEHKKGVPVVFVIICSIAQVVNRKMRAHGLRKCIGRKRPEFEPRLAKRPIVFEKRHVILFRDLPLCEQDVKMLSKRLKVSLMGFAVIEQ